MVYTVDKRGRFTFADPAVERLTGYRPQELQGKRFAFLIRPDWVDRVRRHYAEQVRRTVPETTFQLPIVTKSGQPKWVEQTVTLLDDDLGDDNEPSGLHGVVRDITDRKAAQEALVKGAAAEARSEGLRRARQRVVVAQESVRRNIAQQLHGSVQNHLILLLHRLAGVIANTPHEAPNQELQAIQRDLSRVLEHDVRDISRQLYPAILRQGIVPAVQSLADQFEPILPVRLALDQELVARERSDRCLIPESIRLALYRIAEEALNNVGKHAGASNVAVTLGLDKHTGSLRLSLRDDGRGFDVDSMAASVGIAGMQDYADTMGGECEVSSVAGGGTIVEAVFPISEPVAASGSRDVPSG